MFELRQRKTEVESDVLEGMSTSDTSFISPGKEVKKSPQNRMVHETTNSNTMHSLFVIYLPMNWSQKQIKEFIEKECGAVSKIKMATDTGTDFIGIVNLEFDTEEQCKKARDVLNGKEVEGQKLFAHLVEGDTEETNNQAQQDSNDQSSEPPLKRLKTEGQPSIKDVDPFDADPTGLYGLTRTYLKSLGITPPLSRWVHISNFRCDKGELKDLLGMAGRVLSCNVSHGIKKHARVMFSHPLEAVQAISMLHNQIYYGLPLEMSMEIVQNQVLLPNGLAGVGPGLGESGRPLVDVADHYKKHLKRRTSGLDTKIFRDPDQIEADITGYLNKPTPSNNIESGPLEIPQTVSTAITKYANNLPEKKSPMSLNVGHVPNTPKIDPLPIQTIKPRTNFHNIRPQMQPKAQFGQVSAGQYSWAPQYGAGGGFAAPAPPGVDPAPVPRPTYGPAPVAAPPALKVHESATVEISNLPLSTTFPLLSDKMSAVGPVLSVQLTAPGVAVVRYHHPAYASTCYQLYNNANVMGNMVRVRFL